MKAFYRTFNFIFFLGVFLLGASLLYYSLNRVMLISQSQNWAETSGSVISSKVCRSEGIKSTSYSPNIVYRYTVNGKDYESKEITFGFVRGDESEAMEKVSLYSAGSQVKVFYNTSSPEQSCLEPGGSKVGFAIPISVSIVLMVAGIWGANRARKEKRRLYRSF
jgi:hypothetical protein